MACDYVVFDFGNNHYLLQQYKIRRVSYDPLFIMGGICRISEFWNLSSQLKICGTQIVQKRRAADVIHVTQPRCLCC